MRLVDADEIKKRERDVVLANGAKHRCFDTTLLVEMPTIEVVRCKDCIHRMEDGMCEYKDHRVFVQDDNDFCSWGDKKDE